MLLTQESKNEMKNINTDIYITLRKESNEDYSAFLKLYANSVHIAGSFLKMEWYREGSGWGVQDGEHLYTHDRFMLMYDKTNTIL